MIAHELAQRLRSTKVFTDEPSLRAARRDAWVVSELDELEKVAVALPACVVRPGSLEDVVTVVNLCRESGTALIPAGLRSGVCGGVLAGTGSVLLDLSSLQRVRAIDTQDLVGRFDAGVRGLAVRGRAYLLTRDSVVRSWI